jgi:hypothetical protein
MAKVAAQATKVAPSAVRPAPAHAVIPRRMLSQPGEAAERSADARAARALRGGWSAHNRSPRQRQQLPPGTPASIAAQAVGGRPLPPALAADFGFRLGADLSHVRIHNDTTAAALADAADARAFTLGSHVFFNSAEYRPEAPAGRALLAHELAHVADAAEGPARLLRQPDAGFSGDAGGDVTEHPTAAAAPQVQLNPRQPEAATGGQSMGQTSVAASGAGIAAEVSGPAETSAETGAGKERPTTEQEGKGGGASSKFSITIRERPLGHWDLSYLEAKLSLSGVVECESDSPAAGAGEETKTSHAIKVSAKGVTYEAEVEKEFEKRTSGILAGMTPKAKIGGEGNSTGGHLGLEFSLEGKRFETKFGFIVAEADEKEGIHFGSLEAAVDWKIGEFPFSASDGTSLKCTPTATVKVSIEPNYKRIFQYLAEQAAAVISADALICGAMIGAAAFEIVGFFMTLDDGREYARALDNAKKGRDAIVRGFVATATGNPNPLTDDFTMEGGNQGIQWRLDLQAGRRPGGIPVPPGVIDVNAAKNEKRIRDSAYKKATEIMHQALVQRYWEIHFIERQIPWWVIDDIYSRLMVAEDFGRPAPQEGKDTGGASVLPT